MHDAWFFSCMIEECIYTHVITNGIAVTYPNYYIRMHIIFVDVLYTSVTVAMVVVKRYC